MSKQPLARTVLAEIEMVQAHQAAARRSKRNPFGEGRMVVKDGRVGRRRPWKGKVSVVSGVNFPRASLRSVAKLLRQKSRSIFLGTFGSLWATSRVENQWRAGKTTTYKERTYLKTLLAFAAQSLERPPQLGGECHPRSAAIEGNSATGYPNHQVSGNDRRLKISRFHLA
jgi:hypothetical protein